MKWRIYAIGKPRLAYARAGVEEYLCRFPRNETVEITFLKASTPKEESRVLLEKSRGTWRIALDEDGHLLTTRECVAEVEKLAGRGLSTLSLLIGGAEGHSQQLLDEVDSVWSLSKMTLQHELAMVVLLEQLYRIYSVRAGLPYHREG